MSYDGSLTVLSAGDVDAALASLGPERVVDAQAAVFRGYTDARLARERESGSGRGDTDPAGAHSDPACAAASADALAVQQPSRVPLYLPAGRSLYMPSYARGHGSAVKVLTRQRGGMRATTALLTQEGELEGVLNAEALTGLRNAAGSALFHRKCGMKPSPKSMVVFGAGLQARGHVRLFLSLWGIAACTIVVRAANERARALEADMKREFPRVAVRLLLSSDAAAVHETVAQSDLVVTTTAATEPLFPAAAVSPRTSVMLIGSCKPSMCEVEPALLQRAGAVVVDTVEGCLAEAGEVIRAGLTPADLVELGDDAALETRQRGDVAVFKSVGMGVQDLAIARLVFDEARRRGLGTRVEHFAAPAFADDPRP